MSNAYLRLSAICSLCTALLLLSVDAQAVTAYPYGTLPSGASDTDVTNAYNTWKSRRVVTASCGSSVNYGGGSTVSEGMGYGMLMAAYLESNDTLLAQFYQFYSSNLNTNGVMNWKVGDTSCNNSNVQGTNGATDGDLDVALALVKAAKRWPASSNNWGSKATAFLNIIYSKEIDSCHGIKDGDTWGGCTNGSPKNYNPSYFRTGYLRSFDCFEGGSRWAAVATQSYTVLSYTVGNYKLPPDWVQANGSFGAGDAGGGYGYDSCRTPWAVGMDYLWWGNSSAQTLDNQVTASFWSAGGSVAPGASTSIGDDYNYSTGAKDSNNHEPEFIGAVGVASMVGTNSAFRDALYADLVATDKNTYFSDSLKVVYLMAMTGNFQEPCAGVAVPTPTFTPSSTAATTPSRTASASATPTPTPSQTGTRTALPTGTATDTRTASATASASPSPSPTESATSSPASSPSRTPTASPSATPSRSATASATSSSTSTATATRTASASPTLSPSFSVSPTYAGSATVTSSFTASPSVTATLSPSPSVTGSASASASGTGSPSLTASPSGSASATASASASRTPTPPPASPSPTATPAVPTVNSLAPQVADSAGGTSILINGSNFLPLATVTLGGVPVAAVQISSTQFSLVVPAEPLGSITVLVINPDGTASLPQSLSIKAATPTGSPSATATPSRTLGATATMTATPSVSATAMASADTTAPSQGGGRLQIGRHGGMPSPWTGRGPAAIKVELLGDCDTVLLRLYTPAMVLVAEVELGPASAGWVTLVLPVDKASVLPSGIYYYSVEARRGSAHSAAVKGAWMALR